MADFVTNRAEKRTIIKRFQSYGNDSMAYSRDHFEKNKREECCELLGGRLNFYESAKPGHNTTTTVVEVEKRRGTNILVLRCGPGGRTVIFLEFDSKRLTDEWQEALCRYNNQPYDPNPALRRVRSEMTAAAKSWRRRAITRSTLPDLSDYNYTQVEAAPEQDVASSYVSNYKSLQSFDRPTYFRPTLADLARNSVEQVFTLSDLQQLKVKDYRGDVIVTEAIPLWQLHVGDKIELTKTNNQGHRMNAREMTEYFRTSRNRTVVLTIVRGAVGVVKEEGCELAINIKGSQTVRLDKVDVILRALTSHCFTQHAEMPERPNLTITAINSIPVAIGSQPDQISGSMREALETSGGNLTLHLAPQSLLDALAE